MTAEGWDGHDMNALEVILHDHYLAQIECDHDGHRDRAHCQCSLVSLGWHPSVGAAAQSWVDHVMALVRGHWTADALIRRASADHAVLHGVARLDGTLSALPDPE